MQWRSGRRSDNLVNMRGLSTGAKAGGAGGLFLMAFVVWAMGGNPLGLIMQGVEQSIQRGAAGSTLTPEQEAEQADFVSAVLGSTEDVWARQFASHGVQYQEPQLVLFTGGISSGCGAASASIGPFYCPADARVYLDLDFFQTMSDKLNSPGDFARAYVIAHEVGHHIQNMFGLMDGRAQSNAASVKTELQADCLAGVWAHGAQNTTTMIEPGDIDQALRAASQIGDDVLQERQQGYAVPDSFTHGSAAQRVAAFKRGFSGGSFESCGIR